MKAEKISKSPNGDGLPGQKEDLLERRRLQNRLSQRNHRRKIRDRIAKLQERVIANELRASAALNGWDQHYMPSPLLSNRHVSHSHFNMSPRDHLATDPSAQYSHSYIPTVPWSRDMALNSPLGLMGDRACFLDGSFPTWPKCSSPSASDWTEISGINTLGGLSEDTFQGLFTTGESLPIKSPNNLDQPLYYVATALPQILQVLSAISPQSKIIVLVPPDSASAAAAGYPSPAPILGNGLEPLSPPQINATSTAGYQYQTQIAHGICSAPGSYVPGFPSHKMQSPPSGGFSGMRL